MPIISTVLDKQTAQKLIGVNPPIHTAEDLFSRCSIQLATDLSCDIQDIEMMKLRLAGAILSSNGTPLQSWIDLPSSIPAVASSQDIPRSTGFQSLDTLLNGGIPPSRMIEVLGETGSGKTQFCLSTAIACARCGLKVFIINTNNDISMYRIRRILDFAVSQESRLSAEQRQEMKLFILSNLYIQPAFDLWAAMDLLCRVKEMQLYDIVVIDSLHHIVSPYLTPSDNKFASTSVSATMQPVGAVMQVSCQPLVTQLYLLLRSLVNQGLTVLVTNALEKERGGGSGSVGGPSRSSSVSGSGAGPQFSALRLPLGTGSQGATGDLMDLIVLLSRNEAQDSLTASSFQANIALRPPQFNSKPSSCELRVPKI